MDAQWHEVRLDHDEGDTGFAKAAPSILEALQLIALTRVYTDACALGHRLVQFASLPDTVMNDVEKAGILDGLDARRTEMAPFLSVITSTFTRSQALGSGKESCGALVQQRSDGLVVPVGLVSQGTHVDDVSLLSAAHPCGDYALFCAVFDRLGALAASGTWFTASAPRLKILQGLYALHRTFNGSREDGADADAGAATAMGGPDIRRATKMDVRRLESSVSASSVVRFLAQLVEEAPQTPVVCGEEGAGGVAKTRAPELTVEGLLERFYGRELSATGAHRDEHDPAARRRQLQAALSVESLCLHPSDDSREEGLCWLHHPRAAGGGRSGASAPTMAGPFTLPSTERPQTDRHERASVLLRHILSVDGGGNDGELLRRLVVPALQKSLAWGSEMNRLELELTLTGCDADELSRLAEWCARSGLFDVRDSRGEPQVQFALHITQRAYTRDTAPSVHESAAATDTKTTSAPVGLRDVLDSLFRPIWLAVLEPSAHEAVSTLLSRVTTVAVSLDAVSDAVVQDTPPSAELPCEAYPVTGPPPPDALFLFHIWRHVQLLNAFVCGERLSSQASPPPPPSVRAGNTQGTLRVFAGGPLRLRLHCRGHTQRSSVHESLLGLLLCDHVVNPAHALEWGPLTYLYYLTQRHIQLSPTLNRFSAPLVRRSLSDALTHAVRVGLHASIATLDPLLFSTSNDALVEELDSATRYCGLSPTDATELCLRGLESGAAYFPTTQRRIFGEAWPCATTDDNVFRATQVPSLRIHFRATCFAHEVSVLCRHAFPRLSGPARSELASPSRTVDVVPSALIRRAAAPAPTTTEAWLASATARAAGYDAMRPSSTASLQRLFHRLSVDDSERPQRVGGPSAPTESYAEPGFWYPRIVITGPSGGGGTRDGARAAAKTLVQIANRRTFYQQFVAKTDSSLSPPAHREAPTDGGELGGSGGTDRGLSASSVSAYIPPAHAASTSVPQPRRSLNETGRATPCDKTGPTTPTRLLEKNGVFYGEDLSDFAETLPSWDVFQRDVRALRSAASHPVIQRFAQKRLNMLENKYQLHVALTNDDDVGYTLQPVASSEAANAPSQRITPGRLQKNDVYNCVKVDVHVHMASGVTAPCLLQFMKQKLQEHGDDVVGVSSTTKRPLTLRDVFSDAMSEPGAPSPENGHRAPGYVQLENLTIANLQVHAGKATFNRFDEFNNRFSPMRVASLRSLFLKTDNAIGGRYFAELIRLAFARQEAEGNVFTENRLSIYGRHRDEWDRLAMWFVQHDMRHRTNRWIIQIPRLFFLYRRTGQLKNFGEMLANIFTPLWEATLEPEKHPFLNVFLAHVSGFDSVDNESDREPDRRIRTPPSEWTSPENPPFAYYMYFMWVNVTSLNRARAARGLATFDFRPHAGESGDPDHMADAFFLADGISHGIQLRHRPVLEYLYYLAQIPLGVVPLSNNALFCRYHDNPFPCFLRRGLKVALATDGPLMFHHTEQPLIEEYSTAQNVWSLSSADVCEVARNSVVMSGFPRAQKEDWLGPLFHLASTVGNDVAKSRVPMTRVAFRYEVYLDEVRYLQSRAESSLLEHVIAPPSVEELEALERVGQTRAEVLAQRWRGQPVTRPARHVERRALANALPPCQPRFRVASAQL